MKYGEMNVVCHSYKKWKTILREELELASTFEIHCWQDEMEWISVALQYGEKKEIFWDYGTCISGKVTPEFVTLILSLPKPKDVEIYDKMTPFFSIFLDTGFSSEHYGTELSKSKNRTIISE